MHIYQNELCLCFEHEMTERDFQDLHKQIIEKFKNTKYIPFMDNIWEVNLADIQLIHKYNKRIYFPLSVIDIYRNIPLKEKKKVKQLLKYFKNLWKNQIVN